MYDAIVDISHHNGDHLDFGAAGAAGIAAVIQKATQGTRYRDPTYTRNRAAVLAANLLFGSYHFGTGEDGAAQADFYLATVGPQPREALVLDLEANTAGPSMTLEEARAFVTHVLEQTGTYPILYGGHDLKDELGRQADHVLSNCPLWLAQYGPTPVLPVGWANWSLWQYTDGVVGSPPAVPGIGHCDRSRFVGEAADLAGFWASASA